MTFRSLTLGVAAIGYSQRYSYFEDLVSSANHVLREELVPMNGWAPVQLFFLTEADFPDTKPIPLGMVRNRCLEITSADTWLWFLDADVLISVKSLVAIYRVISQLPSNALLVCNSVDLNIQDAGSTNFDNLSLGQAQNLYYPEKVLAVFQRRSIEIITTATDERFLEDRGKGVDCRVGNENIFLSKVFSKKFYRLNGGAAVAHVGISSGRLRDTRSLIESGHIQEICDTLLPGFAGKLLFLVWLIKRILMRRN